MITCLAIACTSRHSMVPMIRPFSGNATLFWKIFTFSLKAAYISHSIGVYRGFCDIGGAVMGVYAACYHGAGLWGAKSILNIAAAPLWQPVL